jgi:hypothetical protein
VFGWSIVVTKTDHFVVGVAVYEISLVQASFPQLVQGGTATSTLEGIAG